MNTSKSNPHFFAFPRLRHKKFPLIPHRADVVSCRIVFNYVVVTKFLINYTKQIIIILSLSNVIINDNENYLDGTGILMTFVDSLSSFIYHLSRNPSDGLFVSHFAKCHIPSSVLTSRVSDSRGYKRPVMKYIFIFKKIIKNC